MRLIAPLAAMIALASNNASAISLLDECRNHRGIGDLLQKKIQRPEPPSCIRFSTSLNDDVSFQMCRTDMVRYQMEVDSYLKCLKWESGEVVDEFNENVNRFNSMAQ
ncbi:hypothetical protein [Agrobacterium deltaense]|uniref:hypothetical protein n=1 Tax=Agrobacterium deltaense TaxID=1183412 RepID=UPI0009BBCC30|nr:hypothetical protein [Agrobacterium deltaense]